jgi:hypothetical protein
VERAEQAVVARRARRALWAFRLLFYPGAALVAVILLAARGEAGTGVMLEGRTEQGEAVKLQLYDREPATFETTLAGRCTDGEPWTATWHFGRWERRGEASYRRHELDEKPYEGFVGRTELSVEVRVDGDDEARGRAWFVQTNWRPGDARRTYCGSGPVDFSVRSAG